MSGRERLALGAAFALVAVAVVLRRRALVGVALALGALAQLSPFAVPVARSTHETLALQAAAYVGQQFPGRALVAVAPDIAWSAHADPFIGWEPGALPTDPSTNAALPQNAIVAWDSEYSAREGSTALASLHAGGWRDLKVFSAPGVEIRLLSR